MDNTDDNIRKYVDTKLKKINRVLKDPDGYNSGIASNDRVDEMNERVSELEAISHTPVDFTERLNQLHDKIDRVIEMLKRLTDEQSN
jgi:ribosome-associated translation inhibitor RaiA|tara:strand:+ start:8026 stop:8286 length:261 start_codon:yes stop_codon:yes gene_type:complete